jgi:hypothetical protein
MNVILILLLLYSLAEVKLFTVEIRFEFFLENHEL